MGCADSRSLPPSKQQSRRGQRGQRECKQDENIEQAIVNEVLALNEKLNKWRIRFQSGTPEQVVAFELLAVATYQMDEIHENLHMCTRATQKEVERELFDMLQKIREIIDVLNEAS